MVVEGVAWGLSVAGWIMSPIVSKLLDRVLSHCKSDQAETLRNLLTDVLPRLTLTLEAAEVINDRKLFEEMVRGLKSAFYDMEDILDELEYIRHKKQLHGQEISLSKEDKKKQHYVKKFFFVGNRKFRWRHNAEACSSNQVPCYSAMLNFELYKCKPAYSSCRLRLF
jgi:hypothetical protein